jgi:hypothetical protein
MTPDKAFRLYLATRLHFHTAYDVFLSKGRFTGMNKVMTRNDADLIKAVMSFVDDEREMIEFCAANFLYGNKNFLYDHNNAEDNYRHWLKVKGTMGSCLERDLGRIELYMMKHDCSLDDYLQKQVISDLLSRKTEYESLILMNRKIPVIDKIRGFESDKYKALMSKANGFVTQGKLASQHNSHLDNFLNNIKENQNVTTL